MKAIIRITMSFVAFQAIAILVLSRDAEITASVVEKTHMSPSVGLGLATVAFLGLWILLCFIKNHEAQQRVGEIK